ncbi:MAG TPA: amino acid adenylation domain-containing protein, partial [Blastocatellia bacterium]|nr:amino acid adenylation domain-containing protein [Blastocatellia bacterium]
MKAKAENIEAVYPLSPMQQGMYFHSLYAPDSGVYIGQLNCRFIGELDVDAFQRSCQQVVDRHPLLRTAFVGASQERLMQVVGKHVKLPFELLDWRELSAEQQQARLQELQLAERKQGFKLSRAPLMRLKLARLGEDQYHFMWSHHHILLDGWSVPIIFKEVLTFYDAARLNLNLDLPLPIPFQRYISWLQLQDLNAAKAYWQRAFAGHRAPTRLRLPRNGDAASGGEVREARLRLSVEESLRLRKAAQREQVTINTLAQGAWALLLSRYSGAEDVVYGATVSGRPAEIEGVDGMVGLLINSLPVRVVVRSGEEIGEWLRRLQAEQVESRGYEYSPLSEVQKWVGVGGGERMFESLLVFENYPIETLLENQQSSLKIENLQLAEKTNYALTVVAELRERLAVRLEYDAYEYDDETMMRMLGHLCQIIIQLGDKSDRRLSEITWLTPTEREEVLMKWNQTSTPYPQTAWIHQVISSQAALNPTLTAVSFDSRQISYAELNSRANQLARYLRGLGVKPEVCVGVLMERSVELVLSLLGVLKAGAAYVPLDPGYPVERLRRMVEDAGLGVILAGEGLGKVLDGVGQARVIEMSEVWVEAPGNGEEDLEVEIDGENLAYVIYTSGSTGIPKGAMNTHAGILNRLMWMQERYQLTHADRVLQKTPFSFDVSVWEFFWPLMMGAQLVVARPGGHRDSAYLVDLIREAGVTVLHFVPSMLQAFVEERGVEQCASVRQIICSGEALSASLQRRAHELFPCAELDNLYGPTEAAVDVTWWRCLRGDKRDVVPIGYPIANVQMYALDERLEPAPVGVIEELYIGGVNVGRGYLGRADMTAERFTPNPHSRRGGERVYRTGDLGRYLNDGSIEYVGRIDHQVKLHGNRIELGEIEVALSGHPGVKEAVVCVVERNGSGAQLVGYFVKSGRASADVAELRASLRSKLPEYMVPTHFVELAEMPLTPNGKADRRRLPEPSTTRSELAPVFVEPQTAEERTLAEIWSQILRLDRVGVHDNFFALGGDSIRSIQVRSLAQKRGLDFTLQQLFQAPTIRELANAIHRESPIAPKTIHTRPFELISEEDRRLLPDSVEDAYPLASLQAGMLFHSEFNRDTAAYHNLTSYHLKAPLDLDKMQEAVASVMARHATLRTSFDLFTYSEPMQLVHREVAVLIEFEDISHLTTAEQQALIVDWKEKEKATPFDSKTPPLIRFKVHRRSSETFQFSFAEHHAIIDGWSVATMLTELFTCYFSAIGLKEGSLAPPPPLTYRDFVALERSAVASEETKNFWLDKLSDSVVTVVPRWPETYRDRRRPGSSSKSMALTREITQGVKQVAQTVGAPLKSVLLAAHMRVMSFLSGQMDVLTGLVSNGRLEEDGGEKTLGL